MIKASPDLKVGGVILAAGESERFGQPKQLLEWQGRPFIVHLAENALEACLSPLAVVTGANHRLVEAVLCDLPIRIVYNPRWKDGQSSSVIAGLRTLDADCQAAMFLLCDQPQIPSILMKALIARYEVHRAPITAPKVGAQRGNPVLFGWETFHALSKVTGDQGGRAIFDQFEIDWLIWKDPRILLDVDNPEDLVELQRAYSFEG